MEVIGLTGGIAAGKSAVAARLAEHGAVVIDADRLAREAVGATVQEIAAARRGATVVAECQPGNARSEALLRAVGFVPTGTAGRRPGRALFVWRAAPGERIDVC